MVALQTLYEESLTGHTRESILARHQQEEDLPEEVLSFATELVNGINANRDKIDAVIHTFAPMWPIEQISVVDLDILRIAIFEILIDNKIPFKVSINEAIELAKIFGSESSARFINGVLGSVVRSRESNSQEGGTP